MFCVCETAVEQLRLSDRAIGDHGGCDAAWGDHPETTALTARSTLAIVLPTICAEPTEPGASCAWVIFVAAASFAPVIVLSAIDGASTEFGKRRAGVGRARVVGAARAPAAPVDQVDLLGETSRHPRRR